MVRTQILLDEPQYESVRRLAHIHRISFAEAVRHLLARGLQVGLGPGPGKLGAAGLLDVAGIGIGGPADLSEKHDKYLEQDVKE
ncbi:MAG: CopG family transcriptional regulator [Deltaproteobacteria bacterium]|nr:CopG family transcriptional regulator [Deltaproteobacteria bacterium]